MAQQKLPLRQECIFPRVLSNVSSTWCFTCWKICGKSYVCRRSYYSFDNINIRLKSYLLFSKLGYKLVSVGRLADNEISSLFRPNNWRLMYELSQEVIGFGKRNSTTGLCALPNPLPVRRESTALHCPHTSPATFLPRHYECNDGEEILKVSTGAVYANLCCCERPARIYIYV